MKSIQEHNKFYHRLLCNYNFFLYDDSYICKIYNKMSRLNKKDLLLLINTYNLEFNFNNLDNKNDILISVFEYYKLKYECWLIHKYFLNYCSEKIGKKSSVTNKCYCSNILTKQLLKELPTFFYEGLHEKIIKKIKYYQNKITNKKKNKICKSKLILLISNNYIDIINNLLINYSLLCDEIFIEKNNIKKKMYKDKPLTFKKLKEIYNEIEHIFFNEIIKNEINRMLIC